MGIKKHKTFDIDVETMIKFIHQHKDGTIVTIKEIMNLAGINTAYASNVLQFLKSDERLETWKVEGNYRNTYFKLKEEVIPVHKVETVSEAVKVIKNKKFKHLTEEQVENITATLDKSKVGSMNINTLMSIMNIMASFGPIGSWIDKYVDKISDLLIMKHNQVRLYCDVLTKVKLLEIDDCKARLELGIDAPIEEEFIPIEEEFDEEILSIAEPIGKLVADAIITDAELSEKPKSIETLFEPVPIHEPEPTNTDELIGNMKNFSSIIADFQNYMSNALKDVESKNVNASEIEDLNTLLGIQDTEINSLKSEIEQYKSKLEDGNIAMSKLIEENTTLKSTIDKKIEENRINKQCIAGHKIANENLFRAMQERLLVLSADINTTITDYSRMPAWSIKSTDTARVQNQVINAITSAMDDILKAEKEHVSVCDKD